MSDISFAIYILFILFFILMISTFMEFYKKKIRKDKASVTEVKIISVLLSLSVTAFLIHFKMIIPILGKLLPDAPVWIDHLGYFIIIYLLQYMVDMKLIKAVFRAWLKKYGIEDE